MSDPANPACHEYHEITTIAKAIKDSWYTNRRIVPIVGAGLSADSGFPVVRSVVRYLAKLQAIIKAGSPFAGVKELDEPGEATALRERIQTRYADQPWQYVKDFGWPDRFQLNQDLFRITRSEPISDLVVKELNEILPEINSAAAYFYCALQADVVDIVNTTAAALGTTVPDAALNKLAGAAEEIRKRFTVKESWSTPFHVYGDWRRLIHHFTHYHPDYADSLFATLGRFKSPNQGHRYLTFLIRLLSIRTVFTSNFDDLIERAL